MDSPINAFNIHGVGVRIGTGAPELSERLAKYLAPYAAPEAPADVTVDLRVGPELYRVPLHSRRVLRYGYFRSYFLEGRTWFTDYRTTLCIEPDGRRVHGNLDPATDAEHGPNFFTTGVFTLALFEALRFFGLYYMHAAALQDPDGAGYLVSGNSCTGKTTLTLSLIKAGFKFVSDDTVFMRLLPGQDVEVLGFARDFHVPVDLLDREEWKDMERMPDYGSRVHKKLVPPDQFFPGQRLASLKNPAALIFPRMGPQEKIVKLSMAESLNELLPQSISVMFNPATASPHLEALKRVLKHGRGFLLTASPEMKGDAERVARTVVKAGVMARTEEMK